MSGTFFQNEFECVGLTLFVARFLFSPSLSLSLAAFLLYTLITLTTIHSNFCNKFFWFSGPIHHIHSYFGAIICLVLETWFYISLPDSNSFLSHFNDGLTYNQINNKSSKKNVILGQLNKIQDGLENISNILHSQYISFINVLKCKQRTWNCWNKVDLELLQL